MTRAFFVTGTDTGVGKTYALSALLYRIRQAGLPACGLKPVAAGVDADGKNEDIETIRAASSMALPEATLNSYLFSAPIAPHIAARDENRPLRFAPILAALSNAKTLAGDEGVVLVEGVGGFRVPLGDEGDSADLALQLGLPIILVVGMRLGCINHALLTVEAIFTRKLPLQGWIANSLSEPMPRLQENLDTLKASIPAPLLGLLPPAGSPNAPHAPADAAQHLALPF